jgi:hypothetical protein
MAKIAASFVALVFLLACAVPLQAGNKRLIEKRVKQLDELNRKAVEQIPNLPRNGQVKLKTRVRPAGDGMRFAPIEKQIVTTRVLASAPQRPPEQYQSFRSGLRAFLQGDSEIRPAHTQPPESAYTPFRQGLRGYLQETAD